MRTAPLTPARLGLNADSDEWSDDDHARFARAVNELPNGAAPTALTLGLGPDPTKRTDAERRLSDVAYEAWKPIPPENGAVAITDGSSCINERGEYAFAPMHGRVTVYRGDDDGTVLRRQSSRTARVVIALRRAGARCNGRHRRTPARRAAIARSASGSDDPPGGGSDPEGESPGARAPVPLAAGRAYISANGRVSR